MQNTQPIPLRRECQPDRVSSLKKELTEIYKKYNLVSSEAVGQVVSHINAGSVSKIWTNLEVK